MPALPRRPRFAAVRGGIAAALLLATSVTSSPATAQTAPTPPVAPQRPHVHATFGVERSDPYFWIRERADPAVTGYLDAENAYTSARTAANTATEAAIYGEILGRIQQDDASAPVRDNGYVYQTRYAEGQQYPVFVRRRDATGAPDEVLLDGNARAAGHAYWGLGALEISDDNRLMAFAEDTVSRRIYTVRFRDLTSGEMLPDVLETTTGEVVWAADNRTVFYGGKNPETLRSERVMRHRIGTPQSADTEVFFEADDEFNVSVERSKDRAFIFVASDQTEATEVRFVDAATPEAPFTVVEPRTAGLEYGVEHIGGDGGSRFVIRANADGAANFALFTTPVASPGRASWSVLVPARETAFIERFDVFARQIVTQERENGLTRLRIRGLDGAARREVSFDEPTYAASLGANPEYDTATLRYVYSSMTTPGTTYDERMDGDGPDGEPARVLVKRDPVLGDFDAARYVTERVFATASDGTRIPVSIVRARTTPVDGTAPLLLYGYGSYGASMSAGFSIPRLSLLDRGFVYAIAHIRGGQEMGRAWYESGRLMQKMNTFTDFIAAGEHMVAAKYADPSRLYAQGGSAGGLLVGAVVNLRPDLFTGVHAAVPFVDVVTTMLDASIPLTTFEYDEWGNPNEEAAFRYMLSYSPIDNVGAKAYPPLLVTTGLHDSQVQYWEPAKWVAKIRAANGGAPDVLLKTNMAAGHGGASGRFERYREVAFEYAWLAGLAGSR